MASHIKWYMYYYTALPCARPQSNALFGMEYSSLGDVTGV